MMLCDGAMPLKRRLPTCQIAYLAPGPSSRIFLSREHDTHPQRDTSCMTLQCAELFEMQACYLARVRVKARIPYCTPNLNYPKSLIFCYLAISSKFLKCFIVWCCASAVTSYLKKVGLSPFCLLAVTKVCCSASNVGKQQRRLDAAATASSSMAG